YDFIIWVSFFIKHRFFPPFSYLYYTTFKRYYRIRRCGTNGFVLAHGRERAMYRVHRGKPYNLTSDTKKDC
ncbi:hypothetical protein KG091_08380, partial [Carnobacteriaceae bacterium zg-ZUI78]|nr:hypothetical protein [Carnobacteriaceae bacterium zg-ZUI78]